jgi:ATP-dependent Zn protease
MVVRSKIQKMDAAYHETGHAIAALVLNAATFVGVSLVMKDDNGESNVPSSNGRLEGYFSNNHDYISNVIVYYAGPYAEHKFREENILFAGADSDKNCINTFINEINEIYDNIKYDDGSGEYKCSKKKIREVLFKVTEQLVEDNKDQIKFIAEKLYKRTYLTREEIIRLLIKHKMYDTLEVPKMPKLEEFKKD